ncbi:uncharacterized protein K02A2.6-like [Ornithodoros turicata]|uniref:uncharacterized protein K02A2.6-like n=1 Tax=Ornithodoros turicata TaxID=34597 RepID=UPI003138A7EB
MAKYNPNFPTVLSADASSYGLGGVLSQVQRNGELKPVAYASRSLNSAESRYSQVEKEALALTWAAEKFEYIRGLRFKFETDHKPLLPLLGDQQLDQVPPRVQRSRLRLMRYDYDITYVPGKSLVTADALSRPPLRDLATGLIVDDATSYVQVAIDMIPASDKMLSRIREAQKHDTVCRALREYCEYGRPPDSMLQQELQRYHEYTPRLSVSEDLLLCGQRIVIPTSLRAEILCHIHEGHQGISWCREKAKDCVWWPGLSKELADIVKPCPVCQEYTIQPSEPMVPTETPLLPWDKVAVDLFHLGGKEYVLVVDYRSRFPEVSQLTDDWSSRAVILRLKSIFARHGIPREVVTDNGPQFSGEEFKRFAQLYGFIHTTTSPSFPQANGQVERTVRTVKLLIQMSDDPHLALLNYRNTPAFSGRSPAQILMGRRLRSSVPQHPLQLLPAREEPRWDEKNKHKKEKQKRTFDRRHRARGLPPLENDDVVWLP